MFDGEGYFEWLWQRSEMGPKYHKLLTFLYTIKYVPMLVDDENRRTDGNALIEVYCQEMGYDLPPVEEFDFSGCTVLEMLLALADRINNELIGDPETNHAPIWFEQMLENLGIYQYDDDHWDEKACAVKVWNWMHKRGNVHLFCAPFSKKKGEKGEKSLDFRKISEWELVNLSLNSQFLSQK
jgi:hypothetical protein